MFRSYSVVFLCVVYCAAVLGKIHVHTDDKIKYKFFPYSNTTVHFKVKAANDVHIALTTGPHETDPMVEVVIGGWGNTNSVIRRRFKTVPDKVSVETPGILNAGELRGFWIRWVDGLIAVGREGTNTPFMFWTDPEPFHVTHLGVHTGFGSTGSWIIEDPSPAAAASASQSAYNPLDLYTEDKIAYKFFPYSNTYLHFKVKATNDAHIALTTGPQESDPMIEIVIGGWSNTNSVIRRRFRTIPEKVTSETPGILSGGDLRGFWIRWDRGFIAVGREGEDTPFMSWTDSDPFPVSYVGVHTGFGATGSWVIEDPLSRSTVPVTTTPRINALDDGNDGLDKTKDLYTEDKVKYKFFAYSNTSVHFKVKAANDVHVALTTGPYESDPMIEVVIGGWSNTNSVIRRRFRTLPEKVSFETPGILSGGELRGFWIRWDGGVIAVGREGEDTPFMSWTDPKPFPVSHVGVHTGFGSTGCWIFEDPSSAPTEASSESSASNEVVSSLRCKSEPLFDPKDLYTEDEVKYKFFSYSNTSVQFKVKAGNDAHIGLTTGPQVADPMIEVVIGGWSNTNSVIRRRFRTLPEKVSVETPGILSGGSLRGFWIRWDGGVIAVGREGVEKPFMSWTDPEPFPVSYVGVHTGFGSTGSWIFEVPLTV